MTAHEWKHYNGSGTGIRSLLDCYIYYKTKGDSLDWNYIKEQCEQLEIADFEQQRRQLGIKTFSTDTLPNLTDADTEMLMYYLSSGTYGTLETGIRKKLKEQSKASFILQNLFPDVQYMRQSVRFVNKCTLLYPIGIVYRWGRILVKQRKHLSTVIKIM